MVLFFFLFSKNVYVYVCVFSVFPFDIHQYSLRWQVASYQITSGKKKASDREKSSWVAACRNSVILH